MSLVNTLQDYINAAKTDFPASLEMLSEEVQWINLLPEHVPFGGEYRGREGVAGYFGEMADTFVIGDYIYDQFEYIETEDTVVLVGFEKDAQVPATGKTFDLHFVWVVKFDSAGKICYLREHNDTAAIGDAFKA
ncbi:MAG: nuclear transport factor 2 family protein [Halioglobus sp.]